MNGITVNLIVMLINGVPQCLLAVLAMHIIMRTKLDVRKYLLLSLIYIVTIYLIRLLPIALGVNSVLLLFVMVISFGLAYKTQLSKVMRIIASAALTLILIAVSEVLNMLILTAIYGKAQGEELFTSTNGLIRGVSTTPTNIVFAFFIGILFFIFRAIDRRKIKNGETGAKTGG
jgi:hypothetical protein